MKFLATSCRPIPSPIPRGPADDRQGSEVHTERLQRDGYAEEQDYVSEDPADRVACTKRHRRAGAQPVNHEPPQPPGELPGCHEDGEGGDRIFNRDGRFAHAGEAVVEDRVHRFEFTSIRRQENPWDRRTTSAR